MSIKTQLQLLYFAIILFLLISLYDFDIICVLLVIRILLSTTTSSKKSIHNNLLDDDLDLFTNKK